MKLDLKSCLEQIIQLSAYPKQIFTFQVTVVGKSDKRHTFAACLNACIALLN
jgi:ribonuclease PH